jgi:hypothetical protein
MQAGEEHVDAEEGKDGDQQAYQHPPYGNLSAQTFHQAQEVVPENRTVG